MTLAMTAALANEIGTYGLPLVVARLATIVVFLVPCIGVSRRWISFRAGERWAWLGGFFLTGGELAKLLEQQAPSLVLAFSIETMVVAWLLITYIVWAPDVARRIGIALCTVTIGSLGWLLATTVGITSEAAPLLAYPLAILSMCEGVIARTRVATGAAAAARAEAELGRTDMLTGLDNRRGILPRLDQVAPGDAVLIIDVDHFKQVNDRHGHDVGDAVLRRIAAVLADVVREGDAIGRWGGEEFVVVTGRRSPSGRNARVDAQALGTRLCAAVRDDMRDPRVTVSVGAGWARAEDTDWQDLLRRADRCLYEAKESGRDRVVVEPPDHEDAATGPTPARAPDGPRSSG